MTSPRQILVFLDIEARAFAAEVLAKSKALPEPPEGMTNILDQIDFSNESVGYKTFGTWLQAQVLAVRNKVQREFPETDPFATGFMFCNLYRNHLHTLDMEARKMAEEQRLDAISDQAAELMLKEMNYDRNEVIQGIQYLIMSDPNMAQHDIDRLLQSVDRKYAEFQRKQKSDA